MKHSVSSATAQAILQQRCGPQATARLPNKRIQRTNPKSSQQQTTKYVTAKELGMIRSHINNNPAKVKTAPPLMDAEQVARDNERQLLAATLRATSSSRTIGRTAESSADARKRKERMKKIDAARNAFLSAEASKDSTSLTVADRDEMKRMQQEEALNPALKYARSRNVEDLDEVKAINQRVNLAKIVEDRKYQIEEKKRVAAEAVDEERYWVQQQNEELANLKMQLAQERKEAYAKKMATRQALKQQMEERANKRIEEQEAKEVDAQRMRQMWQKQQREEQEQAKRKIEDARRRREILNAENTRALTFIKQRQEEDQQRDMEALHWALAKDAREKAAEEQKLQRKRARELAHKKQLAQQQRAIDTRADEDERRAKLHQEQRILREREAQAAQKNQRKALMDQVMREREHQRRIHAQLKEQEAQDEMVFMAADAEKNMKIAEKERRIVEARRKAASLNRSFVELQLRQNEETKAEERARKYKEREDIRRQEARRARLVQSTVQNKISALKAEGVSEKSQKLAHLI